MSSTAAAPVADPFSPNAVLERHNKIASQLGAPAFSRPGAPPFGPAGKTPETVREIARVEATSAPQAPAKTPASTPTPKPTAQEQAAKLASFDAEMLAKGLQTAPQPAAPAPGEVDPAFVDALNRAYAGLKPAERTAAVRAQYESELREGYEGRRLGESREAFRARQSGATQPTAQPAAAAPTPTYTPAQAVEAHRSVADANGWIPAASIGAWATSGYTLPKLVEGQRYHQSIFAELATARAANISQSQVEGFIREGMKGKGWIPA